VSSLTGGGLTQGDYAKLTESGITVEIANRAGLRRVDSREGGALVGRKGGGDFSGIDFPYLWPGDDHVREHRLRRDHPDFEMRPDGSRREKGKYLSPPGRGNMLYFAPWTDAAWLTDAEVPIVLTEGEKKALALWRINSSFDEPECLPIALPGVWNWRGTVGKTTGNDGTRRDVKGPIPDLARMAWEGRRVTIVFDANATTNESVSAARDALAVELTRRGAEVFIADLPEVVGVNGVDDLIGLWGPDRVRELIGAARVWKGAAARVDNGALIVDLAGLISARDRFARDAGGRLYHYTDGVYLPTGEAFVKTRVRELVSDLGQEKRWSSRLAGEVEEYLRIGAPQLWDRPMHGLLNVANGLLDLQKRTLLPHSPTHLSPVQIPVAFQPEATCEAWDAFIEATFPADAREMAFEIIACIMAPITSVQKAILLLGEGANGKSTFLNAVMAFIGRNNIANLSLHRLEADRFAVARLMGKLANICPDLPSEHLAGTSMFKAIVGGDPIPAEYKFRDGFDFVPFARLVFSANHPPRSNDSSEGFFRRWTVVPFDKTFTPDTPGYVPKHLLDKMLADPAELSGVLNRAAGCWCRIAGSGAMTTSDSMRAAWDELRAATDPFAVWLDTATLTGPELCTPIPRLMEAYSRDCTRAGRPPMSSTAFGRGIKRYRPGVEDRQRTVDGRVQRVYLGLGLRCGGTE
jgi:P4 family phage/plasmid primase-like protien